MRTTIAIGSWVVIGWLCAALSGAGCSSSHESFGGESHFLRPCTRSAQCEDLGDEYACVAGHCRVTTDASTSSTGNPDARGMPAADANDAGDATGATGVPSGTLTDATPLVMLLVDTSASMERTTACSCSSPGCDECLPDCANAGRNRWAEVLEVLTGTYDDFSCEALERTVENGMTYDVGFAMPYHRPSGTQRRDGVLDSYRDRLRFGLATFDSFDTFVGALPLVPSSSFDFSHSAAVEGMWSYNPWRAIPNLRPMASTLPGDLFYPGCSSDFFIDNGIRSERADEGALRVATDPARAGEVNDAIQESLLRVRPFGGTPTAAALDDLSYFFAQDHTMAVERSRAAPKHVVLVTDGLPDPEYRDFNCDCAAKTSSQNPTPCGADEDPAQMHCPYPAPEQAARALRCGPDVDRCDDTGVRVHVIGFSVSDDTRTQKALDAIAIAGGDSSARLADSELELRGALEEVLANLAD